jgi:mannose-1-phosphate guanylyltransferase/phosphomannomutase
VQFLASLVRTYFGDGEELGMHLSYATEETPLGTAGSVRNAHSALRDDAFLVISATRSPTSTSRAGAAHRRPARS